MCLDPHQNSGWGWYRKTCLSPSVTFLLTIPRRCIFCGSFSLVMFHVCLCYAVLSVSCSLVVTCWVRAYLLALLCVVFFLVFYHLPICILIHIRTKGEVGKICLSPPVMVILTVPRWCFFCGSSLLFMLHNCRYYAVLTIPCSPAGEGLTSWLSCVWHFLVFLSLSPYGVSGQVWHLIVLIPDPLPSSLLYCVWGVGEGGLSRKARSLGYLGQFPLQINIQLCWVKENSQWTKMEQKVFIYMKIKYTGQERIAVDSLSWSLQYQPVKCFSKD